mmetsp:Transcript_20527/g.28344  ORF Transcript_20527/g.28344 Transcript_20527/m.28344 type:complete len:286 (-) Transcript_20527:76-933(-)|eukprot:CAMPEP_0201488760 /NCGR_PEP_ID=MMETSP0151_2-20130828/19364_1 /ASSEMBLY_ACC=CAM_ASM_000257 /TAXON_ID=200890 /ORGANISM="Paramoeba atlantica, Strain 621/1 / CCAP 1560/9" /LENGTH=285 /DNA_ID=CAMNT_0047874117 /DNA_START=52 /DNA_END=909 /DNA_ORIENTATION=-
MADRTIASPEELDDVSLAAQKLWELDTNRFQPNVDYALNLQQGKKVYQTHDAAEHPLFKFVNKEKFFSMPTYKTFYALLDNYERSTGTAETVTHEEKQENWAFLNAIMQTDCMKYVHKYLVRKNLASQSEKGFKSELYKLWFNLYRRESYNDSSGFEHVFVGEEKNGKITGFHNWIQFFIEEIKGNLDYRGYILPRRRRRGKDLPDGDEHILSLQFSWGDEGKDISTSFMGVSPEFEVALYTLMFLASGEKTTVELDGFKVSIRCYHIHTKHGVHIGSSFPELLD